MRFPNAFTKDIRSFSPHKDPWIQEEEVLLFHFVGGEREGQTFQLGTWVHWLLLTWPPLDTQKQRGPRILRVVKFEGGEERIDWPILVRVTIEVFPMS